MYQIHLSLNDLKPEVWRRIILPADVELSDLHKIIQTTMGWTNSHLHQFIHHRNLYEPPAPENVWDSMGEDYTGMRLDQFLEKKNDKLTYEYDFGDSWEHEIKLENILKKDKKLDRSLPMCIDGKMACPPDDCGGVWGYQELLEALNNPNHPEHEDYLDWEGF